MYETPEINLGVAGTDGAAGAEGAGGDGGSFDGGAGATFSVMACGDGASVTTGRGVGRVTCFFTTGTVFGSAGLGAGAGAGCSVMNSAKISRGSTLATWWTRPLRSA